VDRDPDPIAGAGLSPSLRSAWALSYILILSLLAGTLVFVLMVRQDREPRWDEASHGLQAVLVAHDIRERDLPALFLDIYRQVYWPPLHSVVVAIGFLLSGTSLQTMRGVSVIAFVLIAPVLFLTARSIEPRHWTLAGSVAAGLALTSPAFIAYGALAMLEMLGALTIALTALVYVRLEAKAVRPRRRRPVEVDVVARNHARTERHVLAIAGLRPVQEPLDVEASRGDCADVLEPSGGDGGYVNGGR